MIQTKQTDEQGILNEMTTKNGNTMKTTNSIKKTIFMNVQEITCNIIASDTVFDLYPKWKQITKLIID